MDKQNLLVEIGNRLRDKRKELNLTQAKTAEILNISTNFYGDIERGRKSLSIEKIIVVAEKLNIDPTYLLTGDDRNKILVSELFADCPKEKRYDIEQIIRYACNLYRN